VSYKIKKTLLILFGELRTFEYVIPFLNKLDKVDVVLSTWNESKIYDSTINTFIVDEKLIIKTFPEIKQYHIVDPKEYENHHPSWKMYWHWKNAINNLNNPNDYENVILHRCDMISNWETILDAEIEDDILYLSLDDDIIPCIGTHGGIWVNDYYFFGKFNIMKKFINLFNKEDYTVPHVPIWEIISENNINFKNFKLKNWLIRYCHVEWLKDLIKKNKLSTNSEFNDMWSTLLGNK
jgi:hypothetical protein